MVKKLLSRVQEYTKYAIATPLFMLLEVAMEMVIPLLMASIIDKGINAGDMNHILVVGAEMLVAAGIGLFAGIMGGKCGAYASAGLAKNLRQSMFERIQTYSFANIDKFSSNSLITRLTTDVTNVQNAFQMLLRMGTRAPASLIVAVIMTITISPKLSTIYLTAVAILLVILIIVMPMTHKRFKMLFERYDAMNERVQENVSAVRVVKAYVREDHEIDKFSTANQNIYRLSVRAERLIVIMMPTMMAAVYTCIMLLSWNGAKMIVDSTLTTG
ncbi:MAG: ABC transporter ATP-binding protein, partial [Lachnospiraceae bacterium]|nr:ABC transporter ATP-binding protein [Lachnospiraceae bacterium]